MLLSNESPLIESICRLCYRPALEWMHLIIPSSTECILVTWPLPLVGWKQYIRSWSWICCSTWMITSCFVSSFAFAIIYGYAYGSAFDKNSRRCVNEHTKVIGSVHSLCMECHWFFSFLFICLLFFRYKWPSSSPYLTISCGHMCL